MKHSLIFAPALLALLGGPALADPMVYTHGDTNFEAYVATPDGTPRGTVLLVHDWDGLTEHERAQADALAADGYLAVALDLFGTNATLDSMDDYRRETGALYADRDEFRARMMAGAEAARALDGAGQMVIAGYCFGGAAALEAARAGMDMAGFVSFHGGLETPEGQDYSATPAPVMVLHGSADPVSGMAELATLMDELQAAEVPHEARIFGGARHSFTVPGSRDFDETANAGAQAAFREFLDARF
ncbi:MAG: putative hydrolase [Roseibaca calidilacus]|uniref:Dienelactone hydrolase n=1 Tax=Roseibaca calidilacus TaxID=1666912 RepID=A0A0P7X1N4_9RHOB|nr:dienelactone hydrolase family protein [Roseibaca calidilacus]KPP94191.1 MAG: putative hydrolase [Roseibaca calidilacus]CUX81400.1 Dienelactone hydrolase [Roseibaca calidilacus]